MKPAYHNLSRYKLKVILNLKSYLHQFPFQHNLEPGPMKLNKMILFLIQKILAFLSKMKHLFMVSHKTHPLKSFSIKLLVMKYGDLGNYPPYFIS